MRHLSPTLMRAFSLAAVFLALGPDARALTITEIMYNPAPGWVEYIEIYNEDAEARDLSHYYFSRGITFRFPGFEEDGAVFIRGKSYLVVAADVEKMVQLYPHLRGNDPLFPLVVGPAKDAVAEYGVLNDAGETIALSNPGGAVDAEVRYNNRGGWPSAADGPGHSLVLKNPDLDDPNENDNWTWSPLAGGSPGLANFGQTVYTNTVLVGSNDRWKFFRGRAEPSEPRDAWRGLSFNEAGWEEGPTPLGFGDGCYSGTVLDDMMGSYISVYLRKTFEVPNPSDVDVLILKVAFDDGFVAYLNGAEVARKNMAAGDAFDSKASGSSECTTSTEFDIPDPKARIAAGTNVLAIQVHNSVLTNNDSGIIPELVSRKGKDIGSASKVDVDLNELLWNTDVPWLELYNDQDAEQDLSGFFLSDDVRALRKYTFPPGTKIAPRGFLVVDQTQLEASGIQLKRLTDRTKFLALSRSLPDQPLETGLQVVDAYRFRIGPSPSTREMSDARYPDGDRNWITSRVPTRGAPNTFQVERNVVINEIMYHPFHPYKNDHVPGANGFEKPEDQGEYIEIYNRGEAPVNIGGWAFSRGVEYEFPPGTTLAPGGFLVVARDPEYIRAHYELSAAQVLGPWYNVGDEPDAVVEPAVLADGGERVELVDEIGNPADSVRYADNSRWSQWADTRGSSLERIDPHQDGRRAGNWDASDESGKSEWKHYSYRAQYTESEKELMIILLTRGIALMDNLSVTDPGNPAAGNLIKNGDFELPLTATWMLDGTHIHSGRTTADKKDGAASLKIISTGRGNNRLDRIRYANPAFPTRRELVLEFDAKWICGEATLMFSGAWNTFARRFFLEVPKKLGTPGRENSVRARLPGRNQGPLVERVSQTPVLPGANQQVVVTAEVTDSDGVKDVKLRYGIDAAKAAVTEVPLRDDGQAPDLKALDGVYSATIPGQLVGKRVVFSIEAQDNRGNHGRFPYDDRQRTHPYLLDPDTEDPLKLRYAVYIHAAMGNQNGGVPEYRMLMTQENTQYLTTRHTMNNDVIDSSFVWNNSQIWYNASLRYGNSPWTRPGGKSYVLKLPREDLLQGYKKFKLDNRGSEINERVVYQLIRAVNVPGRDPAPYGRSTYVRPFLNAGSVGSVFERVEIPGKQFLDRWWPEDSEGVLYKVDDKFLVNLPDGSRRDNRDAFIVAPPDRAGSPDDVEEYRWYFLHRSREKYDDFSELIELAKFFTASQTPAQVYDAELFDRVNVEATVRTLAIEINVDDWDTWGTTRGKNCYFYRPRSDGRWTLIGWDKDLTLANAGGLPLVPAMFPECARLLNSPGGKRVYHGILSQMLDTFFNRDYLNAFFNQHARDRDGRLIPGLPANAGSAANFLNSRAGMIRNALPRVQPSFEVVTGGAEEVVVAQEPVLVVEGNAPLSLSLIVVENLDKLGWPDPQGDLRALVLDVNSGDLAWPTTTKWKTRAGIPLAKGVNELIFEAFSADGSSIGSDNLRVFYNLEWSAPQVTAVAPAQGPLAGGSEVTVRGSGFRKGAQVFFGAVAAVVKSVDEVASTILAVTPPGTPGPVDVKVLNVDGQSGLLAAGFTYAGALFNRGDVNHDLTIDLTDVINILSYQFFAGALPCMDAADVDDSGEINLSDPIALVNYQFLAAQPPARPFDPTGAQAGEDPTPGDPLGCNQGR